MSWLRRKPAESRRAAPTSPDPVAAALRDAALQGPLVPTDPLAPAVLDDLPLTISVHDWDGDDGFDTLVSLADEVHDFCDPTESGLAAALAEQPGILDVFEDSDEVVLLRTRLSLEDVHAAVVRAVVEVNRRPRVPSGDPLVVDDDEVGAIADAVWPVLREAGFARQESRNPGARYFSRRAEDGFVQAANLFAATGELTDGTDLRGRVELRVGVLIPEIASTGYVPQLESLAVGHCDLEAEQVLEATPAVVGRAVRGFALPWLEATRSRAALAAWLAEEPDGLRIPDLRPVFARRLAEWGFTSSARAVLAHLSRESRLLRKHPDAVEARRLLRASGA